MQEIEALKRRLEQLTALVGRNATPAEPSPDEVDKRISQYTRQIAEAEQKAAVLRDQIEQSKLIDPALLFGASLRPGRPPKWVECVAGGVIVQPERWIIATADLRMASAGKKSRESELFAGAAQAGYVVFLIRPSGYDSFEEARSYAEKLGAQVGFEPVDEGALLRFR